MCFAGSNVTLHRVQVSQRFPPDVEPFYRNEVIIAQFRIGHLHRVHI